ncbi:MAG: ABC transporter ATP-binding protein [Candidatus Krumholzibacteria bacterium]|nr:ABC transporter ATP-binding protein [Candidatus Krumholzibacteria bacterium]MDP6668852.1 ABC transporter ATP-binding protein [Candidatus Krumholzibacteria bacterium]MDP6796417.1 ABC transporter ATP-binding protein [Candidatus Krumholzibacteria bacterium]MDP7020806.1 ABC transporter ATP-binding protein [Candidatus Krumholzibacteria bacterium]
MPETLLIAEKLCRGFDTARGRIPVLEDCSLEIREGESLSILGESGSGKSTLLYLLGTLDRPDSGTLSLEGRDLLRASSAELSRIRNRELGFVFQFHHLLPEFSALENVAMPGLISGLSRDESFKRAALLLSRMEMDERMDHRPAELSGGEQQRVAVSRSLLLKPRLLFADEPTGNLDEAAAESVSRLLFQMVREEGLSLALVTHDRALAARADRSLRLQDGSLSLS